MADQNRKQQNQDPSSEKQNSPRRDDQPDVQPPASDELPRESSTREPASTAHDRGLIDELDNEADVDVDPLGDETSIEDEDEDLSSR